MPRLLPVARLTIAVFRFSRVSVQHALAVFLRQRRCSLPLSQYLSFRVSFPIHSGCPSLCWRALGPTSGKRAMQKRRHHAVTCQSGGENQGRSERMLQRRNRITGDRRATSSRATCTRFPPNASPQTYGRLTGKTSPSWQRHTKKMLPLSQTRALDVSSSSARVDTWCVCSCCLPGIRMVV